LGYITAHQQHASHSFPPTLPSTTDDSTFPMAAINDPVGNFFAQFTGIGFNFDTQAPIASEFHRLRVMVSWNKRDHKRFRAEFHASVASEFLHLYGEDVRDLGALQRLCVVNGIEPIPTSITQCRKVRYPFFLSIRILFESI
jgi:hypothetical protein